jgi:uncharacterized spore protein YtfJ
MGTNLNNNFDALFGKMENYVSTKTVVGEPMKVDNTIFLPLIDVAFGVGAGSVEQKDEKKGKDCAAGGLGAKITPSAVIAITDGNVQLINVKNQDSLNKIIDMAPGVISRVEAFIKKRGSSKQDDAIKEKAKKAAKSYADEVESETEI